MRAMRGGKPLGKGNFAKMHTKGFFFFFFGKKSYHTNAVVYAYFYNCYHAVHLWCVVVMYSKCMLYTYSLCSLVCVCGLSAPIPKFVFACVCVSLCVAAWVCTCYSNVLPRFCVYVIQMLSFSLYILVYTVYMYIYIPVYIYR